MRSRRLAAGLALALLATTACAGPEKETGPARDLVLITIDTWRGDHFDAARAGSALTPELSAFADGGVRFSAAHSVANETSPGTAGILTGLLPRRSGVVVNAHMLPSGVPSLATILAAEGFATAAVVSNPVLRPGMGFEQGFASYELVPRHAAPKARADAVTDAALAALDAVPADGRRFLWVHYLDPHGPYSPPAETLRLFPRERFEAPRDIPLQETGRQNGFGAIPTYQQHGPAPVSRDGRDYLARYAAEVRFLDAEVGRLLAGLGAREVLDGAVVAVSSDHGEALVDDHGYYFSHGNGITQDQVHVPLFLRCPGCPSGASVARPVSTVDLAPTVLARLGVPVPAGLALDGDDLLADGARGVYSQSAKRVALRDGDWKVTWRRGESPVLYHLAEDPGELHDLATEHPDRLRLLMSQLQEMRRLPPLSRPVVRGNTSEEAREHLQALGYL